MSEPVDSLQTPTASQILSNVQSLRQEFLARRADERREIEEISATVTLLTNATIANAERLTDVERRVTELAQAAAAAGAIPALSAAVGAAAVTSVTSGGGVVATAVVPPLVSPSHPSEGVSSPVVVVSAPSPLNIPTATSPQPTGSEGKRAAGVVAQDRATPPRPTPSTASQQHHHTVATRGESPAAAAVVVAPAALTRDPNRGKRPNSQPLQPPPRPPQPPPRGAPASAPAVAGAVTYPPLEPLSSPVSSSPPPAAPSSPSRASIPQHHHTGPSSSPPRAAAVARNRNQHPCIRVYGHCNYGESCKFARYPWMSCLSFLKGRCTFGEECHELHPDLPLPPRGGGGGGGGGSQGATA